MLYTIMPIELTDYTYESAPLQLENMMHNGTLIEYYRDKEGNKIIHRLLSTHLSSYLNVQYQPGSVIKD